MEEYLTIDQAAGVTGRSRATIWNLIRRYELTTYRRPGDRRTYLARRDVERLMEFEPREVGAAA